MVLYLLVCIKNILYKQILNLGSLELEKIMEAIMGLNGRNLDDLVHMDGMNS